MAADFHRIVERLAGKIKKLADRNIQLARENEEAQRRISDLQYDNRQMQNQIVALQQQLQHLTVVSTLQATDADKERSRAILANLIREIDQCINDLTD